MPVDALVDLLDLEAIEVNIFRGRTLHGYFLRPGDPSVPIVYDVDRTRDGRSFNTRAGLSPSSMAAPSSPSPPPSTSRR